MTHIVLESTHEKTVGDITYSILQGKERYVHINDKYTNKNSVLVRLEDLKRFIEEADV